MAGCENSSELYLADFYNDLWLNRRFNLNEIFDEIENLSNSNDKSDLLNFFNFLASECSGFNFTNDKQWSELLNLMGISRLLNHRSLRVKNILKSRSTIELNSEPIRRLNRSAKLGQTIESSLNDLERLISAYKIELVEGISNSRANFDAPTTRTAATAELIANEQILEVKLFLRDKCRFLLTVLRIEFSGQNNLLDSFDQNQLDSWQSRFELFDQVLEKLSDFFDNLEQFQSKMKLLKSLIEFDEVELNKIISLQNEELSQSKNVYRIVECKQKFSKASKFYWNLQECLIKLSTSQHNEMHHRSKSCKNIKFSLPLSKLIDFKRKSLIDEQILGSKLSETLNELVTCQTILNEIMINLRLEFGRFYFVNDDELLKIIALNEKLILNSVDSTYEQQILMKLFNNSIRSFILNDNGGGGLKSDRKLIGVISPIGERIHLSSNDWVYLKKRSNVFSFQIVRILNEVLRKLQNSLKKCLFESYEQKLSIENALSLPLQLINLLEYLKFTKLIEVNLKKNDKLNELIGDYSNRNKLLSLRIQSAEENDSLIKFKLSALISLYVHFISVLMRLLAHSNVDDTNWEWFKQVKYYVNSKAQGDDEDGREISVHIGSSNFPYKFNLLPVETNELDPCSATTYKRLISTRITEKCFLISSYSLTSLKIGANPFGPAGSGKTETIKALGQLTGNQVIVHNCDEANDSSALNRLIFGLARTGLWGCLDEFNRLSSSVLSAVSSTLELIQSSLSKNQPTIECDDLKGSDCSLIRIDPTAAFFVTFNPIGNPNLGENIKSYSGRRKLPTNLRNLFNPISMVRIEFDCIFRENLLAQAGYFNALLGEKFDLSPKLAQEFGVKFKQLFEEMKSNYMMANERCEWDLRLLVAILRRIKFLLKGAETFRPDLNSLLARAIEFEIIPRLRVEECRLFEAKLIQIFSLDSSYERWTNETSKNYQFHLREQLKTRQGVLLLGPTNCGKSRTWTECFEQQKDSIKCFQLNPKSCTKRQFYGFLDESSAKWVDGEFTLRVRESLKILNSSQSIKQIWLILDGPIEPDWVEALNSVLDDNQVLTLSSGERINFKPAQDKTIKLIFETDSIKFASPATISRLGLINYQPEIESEPICSVSNDDSLSEFSQFFNSDKWNLLILIGAQKGGKSFSNYMMKREFTLYTCSAISTSANLLDLLERLSSFHANSWPSVVVRNVDLIKPDKWGTKSFLELLRFIVTYRECNSNFAIQNLCAKIKFILPLGRGQDLIRIEPRVKSRAKILTLPAEIEAESEQLETLEDIAQLNLESGSIFALEFGSNVLAFQLKTLVELHKDYEIFRFNNTNELSKSTELIKEISSPHSLTRKRRIFFILTQLEFELIDLDLKQKLLHYLNFIGSNENVKFVFLFKSASELDDFESYWTTIGKSFKISPRLESETKLKHFLRNRLQHKSLTVQLFLVEKTTCFIQDQSNSIIDEEKLETFLTLMMNLLERSESNLENQRKRLQLGLERLNNFESIVSGLKLKFSSEKENLKERKMKIESAMKSLNKTIDENQRKKIEFNRIEMEQSAKLKQLNERERQIEFELSKIKPLIEANKIELEQYLKPEALNEIKSLREPPKTVKDILEILFVLLNGQNEGEFSWNSMKMYLNKNSLKDDLETFKFKDNQEKLIQRVEQLIRVKSESFNGRQAERASKAIVPIMNWILATLKYGRAELKLRPIRDEMSQFNLERDQLTKLGAKIQLELTELDGNIREQSERLHELRKEFEVAELGLFKIESQLEGSKKTRFELEDQIKRWENQLKNLNYLLSDESLLLEHCLLLALLTVFPLKVEMGSRNFSDLRANFKLDQNLTFESFIQNLLVISATEDDYFTGEFKINSRDFGLIFKLVKIKLCLNAALPNQKTLIVADESLETSVQKLAFKSLLCESSKEISIVDLAHDCEWRQAVELARKLKKLLLVQLGAPVNLPGHLLLDFIDQLSSGADNSDGEPLRAIIFSSTGEPLKGFTCPIVDLNDSRGCDVDSKQLPERALENWIQLNDPEFSEAMKSVEKSLLIKQRELHSTEKSLLIELAKLKQQELIHSNNNELIEILSSLSKLNENFKREISELEKRLREFSRRREKYLKFSQIAANFYKNHVEHLKKLDKFYHLPLDKFLVLLIDQVNDHSNDPIQSVNFGKVIRHALLPMRREDRLEFTKTFESQQQTEFGKRQLTEILSDFLLAEEKLFWPSRQHINCLMILHDKSSPQLEVEEFMRRSEIGSFAKIYATSDPDGSKNVESTLRNLLRASLGEGKVACFCLANAHLASQWLNGNFFNLIKSLRENHDPLETGQLLLILIAEANASDQLRGLAHDFSAKFLDALQVKFWFDELSLDIWQRFDIYERRIGEHLISSDSKLVELMKQLALFHVVCQEKTVTADKGCSWHAGSGYNFDFNQLKLAANLLIQLFFQQFEDGEIKFRKLLAKSLLTFVYNSQLESWEDEQSLNELLGRFIEDTHLAREQLSKFASMRADKFGGSSLAAIEDGNKASGLINKPETIGDQLLARLIGIGGRD